MALGPFEWPSKDGTGRATTTTIAARSGRRTESSYKRRREGYDRKKQCLGKISNNGCPNQLAAKQGGKQSKRNETRQESGITGELKNRRQKNAP